MKLSQKEAQCETRLLILAVLVCSAEAKCVLHPPSPQWYCWTGLEGDALLMGMWPQAVAWQGMYLAMDRQQREKNFLFWQEFTKYPCFPSLLKKSDSAQHLVILTQHVFLFPL